MPRSVRFLLQQKFDEAFVAVMVIVVTDGDVKRRPAVYACSVDVRFPALHAEQSSQLLKCWRFLSTAVGFSLSVLPADAAQSSVFARVAIVRAARRLVRVDFSVVPAVLPDFFAAS